MPRRMPRLEQEGPVRLMLNEPGRPRDWLQVRLQGGIDNRQGLGARVGLRRADGTTVWRRAHTDGSYLSSSDPRVHFGLAAGHAFVRIAVEWPRGLREDWDIRRTNQVVTLKQGTGRRAH